MFSSLNFERNTNQCLGMLLIKVYDSLAFASSTPLASLYLTQIFDALLDVSDAEAIGHLDARAPIHQKVDGKMSITRLVTLALQHRFEGSRIG
jgi:hypothetical protein